MKTPKKIRRPGYDEAFERNRLKLIRRDDGSRPGRRNYLFTVKARLCRSRCRAFDKA